MEKERKKERKKEGKRKKERKREGGRKEGRKKRKEKKGRSVKNCIDKKTSLNAKISFVSTLCNTHSS